MDFLISSLDGGQKFRFPKKTLVGFNESQCNHRNIICKNHPESTDRIVKIKEALESLLQNCEVLKDFPAIDDNDLLQSHSLKHVTLMNNASTSTQEDINSICSNFDSVFMTGVS
ncbi:unnamed protein product [Caenorhabditis auriculariae]|uniref:Uncharacterized protein n=1 Tax=Caenorhabditis auriculariae TaxID=2777116 RepID=A0A8S1HD15_9PELO|nr:unnamed protein product [Caenorhabditis auriculariae]